MIGWSANILMWVGSILVGNRNRIGFLMQATGNAMWGFIGYYGLAAENKGALIGVSFVFFALYMRNFFKWGGRPPRSRCSMRLVDRELLKEFVKEAPALLTIIGVTFAIMCGLLLGGFVTNAALEYLVESFIQ